MGDERIQVAARREVSALFYSLIGKARLRRLNRSTASAKLSTPPSTSRASSLFRSDPSLPAAGRTPPPTV